MLLYTLRMNPYESGPSILQEITESVKLEGLAEGTPEFSRRKDQLHVMKCRELKGLSSCTECVACDNCSLYARVKYNHIYK